MQAIKLTWCDEVALNNGVVASAMYIDSATNKPVLCEVMKDTDGTIKKVIRNGNLNKYDNVYLQGGNNSIQLSKKDSRDIMEKCGGVSTFNAKFTDKNGVQHDRPIVVEFTFVPERGLSQYDPRAYDNKIISDSSVAVLEGLFTL